MCNLKIKIIAAILAVPLIIFAFFCPSVNRENNTANIIVKTDNKNIYYGSEQINLSDLNNPLFSDSEYSYNHKLAVESLRLAVAAFSANVTSLNWGKHTDANRDKDIKDYFRKNSFSDVKSCNYDIGLNDESSKVAFAIAKKTYNHNTDIVAVAIRGGYYGLEWVDNFNIGTGENSFHTGFKKAADGVFEEIKNYLLQNTKKKNVKLWISGYSRGGAVANLVAAMLNDNKVNYPCQVYAYTFASPKSVVTDAQKAHDTTYRNIFNIISPDDPLYNIPPQKWGFGRYGICVVLPEFNDTSYEGSENLKYGVEKSYFSYTGKTLMLSEGIIDTMVNIVIKTSESRNFFANNLSAPICDIIRLNLEKYENENGYWVNYKPDELIRKLHGEKGVESYKRLRGNSFFKSLSQLGISIPEEFYTFIVLCHLNGYPEYEDILFTEINVRDLGNISRISSSSSLFEAHAHEFYMAWLDNISIPLLKFTKE